MLSKRVWSIAGLLILSAAMVAGCGGAGNPLSGNPASENVGNQASGEAKDTPEGTWENYVRDAIAEQVNQRDSNVRLFERYQNPSITDANKGGIVTDIDILADRTEWTLNGGVATSTVDYDVKVSYANGDTDTRTCSYFVQMEQDGDTWYVLNPESLQVFAVCAP